MKGLFILDPNVVSVRDRRESPQGSVTGLRVRAENTKDAGEVRTDAPRLRVGAVPSRPSPARGSPLVRQENPSAVTIYETPIR